MLPGLVLELIFLVILTSTIKVFSSPSKTAKIHRIGQKWKYGPQYVKIDFQTEGHLIFALRGHRNKILEKNLYLLLFWGFQLGQKFQIWFLPEWPG